jgi:hypothetical protein
MKIKRVFVTFVLVMVSSVFVIGQNNASKNNSLQEQLVAMEKQAWESWKTRNGGFFQTFLSEDSINVGSTGVDNKSAIVKFISSPMCEIKSYSMDNLQMIMTDKKTAILTYKAMQDGTCDGKTIPSSVWATSMYVKRNGKWVSNFHQETPVQ